MPIRALIAFLILICTIGGHAHAQQQNIREKIETWQAQADEIEADLNKALDAAQLEDADGRQNADVQSLDTQTEEKYIETLQSQMQGADALISDQAIFLSPLQDQLQALGDLPEDAAEEDPALARERERLTQELQRYEAIQKQAELVKARAFKLLERINQLERDAFTRELLHRSIHVAEPTLITQVLDDGMLLMGMLPDVLFNLASVKAGFLALTLLAYILSARMRRRIVQKVRETVSHVYRLKLTLVFGVLRAVPFLVALGCLYIFLENFSTLPTLTQHSLLFGLAITATIYVIAYLYFAPYIPALRIPALSDPSATRATKQLSLLGGIIGLDIGLTNVLMNYAMTENREALLLVISTIFRFSQAVFLWQLCRIVQQTLQNQDDASQFSIESEQPALNTQSLGETVVRLSIKLSMLLALTMPILNMTGYVYLSQFILFRAIGTGIILAAGLIFHQLIRDFLSALKDDPHSEDESRRQRAQNSVQLVSAFIGLTLCLCAIPVMILLWGGSWEDITLGWTTLANGFSVAGTHFSPTDIFTFFFVFFIGYVITRLVQNTLKRSILPYTRLDGGASNSIVSGLGYLGVIIALLGAVAATGTDLSNLAIVAGALSVGVGFGLQAIVSNFVSGIILLIERPIKIGDWIVTESTEGYVRKINVRSTLIETFDRSTVIVPNSTLISNSVINWTHSDKIGRVIIPVGVSYNSDPRHVEQVLTEIAKNLKFALKSPPPLILFNGFGDSSMDFEIRAFIQDINRRLYVISEANFAIAEAFKRENIEIPFPQRDLYLKNTGALGEALSG